MMSWLMAPNVRVLMDGYSRSNAAKALWQLGQKNMDSGQSKKATKALCGAMGVIRTALLEG